MDPFYILPTPSIYCDSYYYDYYQYHSYNNLWINASTHGCGSPVLLLLTLFGVYAEEHGNEAGMSVKRIVKDEGGGGGRV